MWCLLVEILVVDDVLLVVVVALLSDVVAGIRVDDPIPILLRSDDVVEATSQLADFATVDVVTALGSDEDVALLCLVDADQTYSLLSMSPLSLILST